uniref:Aminoglycoside N(3)-acetyltransferase n=1 Tax=Magnetococcus massalia (strain MO-1) TaxID=451514 RepID=A0A1S7LD21_MAGMO|nr:protein of unknown function, putative aminoglycoside N3'-acetyltransferase-like protein [Candidatus Magnetococcus massalia]
MHPLLKTPLVRLKDRLFPPRLCQKRFFKLLHQAGIQPGAVVMVHSSMNRIAQHVPELNALELVKQLQQMVGEQGTLVMPAYPFRGKQEAYLQEGKPFHSGRTPSLSGLATEIFRRMPGTVRSLHPTHSVTAWGQHAEYLVEDHHKGATFGLHSPFCRIARLGGLVVGIGTGYESFTLSHVSEVLHPRMRDFVNSSDAYTIDVQRQGEDSIPCEVVPLRGDLHRSAKLGEDNFQRVGALRYIDRRGLRIATARADRLIQAGLELIEENRFLYTEEDIARWWGDKPWPSLSAEQMQIAKQACCPEGQSDGH